MEEEGGPEGSSEADKQNITARVTRKDPEEMKGLRLSLRLSLSLSLPAPLADLPQDGGEGGRRGGGRGEVYPLEA